MEVTFITSAFRQSHYPPADKPEIAFAGRSNVGKSTLINVLLNRKKVAKTGSTPGRTRSLNFFSVEGNLYFVDLPGYGYARVSLEERKSWGQMVETYLRSRPNLKSVVVILDIRRDVGQGDLDLLQWLSTYRKEPILVLTKSDKLSRQQSLIRAKKIRDQLEEVAPVVPVVFSSKTREGREEIWKRIRQITGSGFPGHMP
ncbi:MAG: YihA family ribosome biogenesis GTP-binding protein [Deltaproteobacteria bacterium HGW-Deltaproteobacteria-21]|nr:MAG: YihA family ribosome biogenesis GTP-binding protein [Deltaproteobacteria bacterium HGW-Deltaproteobacteria-21]